MEDSGSSLVSQNLYLPVKSRTYVLSIVCWLLYR